MQGTWPSSKLLGGWVLISSFRNIKTRWIGYRFCRVQSPIYLVDRTTKYNTYVIEGSDAIKTAACVHESHCSQFCVSSLHCIFNVHNYSNHCPFASHNQALILFGCTASSHTVPSESRQWIAIERSKELERGKTFNIDWSPCERAVWKAEKYLENTHTCQNLQAQRLRQVLKTALVGFWEGQPETSIPLKEKYQDSFHSLQYLLM